jgi:CRP/FNR family cyclic AMP-dependent transcriptional regulator
MVMLQDNDFHNKSSAPSDFLGCLARADYDTLRAIAAHKQFAKGDTIFRPGGPGRNVYFLANGRVKIFQPSASGREVLLWFCFSGEIFGLAEVARGGGREVSAQACETSDVLAVSQEQFKSFLHERPDAALQCMQVLSSRLRILGNVLVNLVSDDVNTRIAKLILRLSARYGRRIGREIFLTIPLTHQEIADMVGTSRQTVTSVLSALKRQGVLSIDNHRIYIESVELLNVIGHSG